MIVKLSAHELELCFFATKFEKLSDYTTQLIKMF